MDDYMIILLNGFILGWDIGLNNIILGIICNIERSNVINSYRLNELNWNNWMDDWIVKLRSNKWIIKIGWNIIYGWYFSFGNRIYSSWIT